MQFEFSYKTSVTINLARAPSKFDQTIQATLLLDRRLLESASFPRAKNPRERQKKQRGNMFPRNFGSERFLGIISTGKRSCPTVSHKSYRETNISLGFVAPREHARVA